MRWLSSLLFVALSLVACSSDEGGLDGPSRCITNQQVSCPCPGGETSVQVCQADGTFSACQCGQSGGSGQGGIGATGGSSPGGQGGQSSGGQGGTGASGGSEAGGASGTAQGGMSQGGAPAGGQGGQGVGGSCAATLAVAQPAFLIVMDRSGSTMDSNRYSAMREAIQTFVTSAPPALSVGLSRFPEGNFDDSKLSNCLLSMQDPACKAITDDGGCKDVASPPSVATAPLSASSSAIVMLLNGTEPYGNTPTRWALKNAWSALSPVPAAGGRHVILISDGAPTAHSPPMGFIPEIGVECGDEGLILQETIEAAKSGVALTHAIGMPAEEFDAGHWLSALTIAGATARPGCSTQQNSCHHPGNSSAEILAALREIAAVGCRYTLPGNLPASFSLRVDSASGSVVVPKDPQHAQGWDLESPGVVRFYGSACQAIQQAQGSVAVQACE